MDTRIGWAIMLGVTLTGTAVAQVGPQQANGAGPPQSGPFQAARLTGQRSDAQRPASRGEADAAFGLVDYFAYPEAMRLSGGEEALIGFGNEALWECLEERAARLALTSRQQRASR